MRHSRMFAPPLVAAGFLFSLVGGTESAQAACSIPSTDMCTLGNSSSLPVWDVINSSATAIRGRGGDGYASIIGWSSNTTGSGGGVLGLADSDSTPLTARAVGVQGFATNTSGAGIGVQGNSAGSTGTGVYGSTSHTTGVVYGVYGKSTSSGGYAIYGINTNNSSSAYGIYGTGYNAIKGETADGWAVAGVATGTSSNIGIYGQTYSTSGGAWAGYFNGNVYLSGDITAGGTASASIKMFHIDHPQDPANRYLNHASIESSEVLNLYSGTSQLDNKGEAWVTLPAWFDALNKDVRYQLTAIGAPGPNLYVAEKVRQNRFKVAGGQPGTEVSWQVTGVRHDPYVQRHPLVVEAPKAPEERGYYLFPEGYGQPASKSLTAAHLRNHPTTPASKGQPDPIIWAHTPQH